jgi:uncharacterized protein
MLLINTTLKKSLKHGIGLFADQFIPKGTMTWKYHPNFDPSFTRKEVAKMPKPGQKQLWNYHFYDKKQDRYVWCLDDLRFINHDEKRPNIHSTLYRDVALRDIKKGEELLCDYCGFDPKYFDRVGLDRKQLK